MGGFFIQSSNPIERRLHPHIEICGYLSEWNWHKNFWCGDRRGKILEEFDFTIKENSLSNPNIHLKTLSQLITLLLFYSHNSDSIYKKYFAEIDECSDGNYTAEFFEKVDQKIFSREYVIYDEKTLKHGFGMQRAAFLDCMKNNLDEKEMLEKNPRLSYLYIKSCCEYCESQEKKANLKVVKW